jgi:TIR domain
MADIFISYAREDREKAGELARAFEKRQWTVWWDREIALGLSFDEVIERELLACRCAIVLWTASSVASRWVRREARSAARREVLVPILAADVEPPLEFADLQTADLTAWERFADHPEFEKVVRRIEQLAPTSAGVAPGRSFGAPAHPPADAPRAGAMPSPRAVRAPSSWMESQRRRIVGIGVTLAVGLAAGTLYWTTRPATSPTAAEQGGERQTPPASDPPPSPPAASDRQEKKPDVIPSSRAAKEANNPPSATKSPDREAREARPQSRTFTLPGFQLTINQENYFNVKEFAVADLDPARDFLISFNVKSTRTGGSTRYGIAWNFQPDDFLLFTLHSIGSGYYSIGAGRSRSYRPFARFSEGSLNIHGERDFDALQLRKSGDYLVFSINGREVWRTSDVRLLSNKFAFWVADFSDAAMNSYVLQQ